MILDQLRAYCDCVQDITEDEVADLINLVSMATCWQSEPCETFLTGARREVIDLPSCADCPITFKPFYHPFLIDSFKFYLVKVEGIEEEVTEITDFRYHASDGMFHIIPGLPSCRCGCDPCGCPPSYKMVVEYTAGYDEIPDCLLPVFCNVLEVIRAKRDCKCCDDCGCETEGEPNIKYASGDVVSVQLETDIGKLLVEQYKNQIGMLSLCKDLAGLWGLVV